MVRSAEPSESGREFPLFPLDKRWYFLPPDSARFGKKRVSASSASNFIMLTVTEFRNSRCCVSDQRSVDVPAHLISLQSFDTDYRYCSNDPFSPKSQMSVAVISSYCKKFRDFASRILSPICTFETSGFVDTSLVYTM